MEDVQEHLEFIYGIHCEARAESFVVDHAAAAQLGSTGRTDEELLVHEDEGGLGVALYFAPALLARLRSLRFDTLGETLGDEEGALGSYCQLAEGVSHFLYLAQSAALDRSVSLLELEAQAEVDKFATCLLHRWREGTLSWARELHQRLFDRVAYRPGLDTAEKWRYGEANRLARNYCSRLLPHVAARRLDLLLGKLRYSYRLGAEAKLQHLALAPASR